MFVKGDIISYNNEGIKEMEFNIKCFKEAGLLEQANMIKKLKSVVYEVIEDSGEILNVYENFNRKISIINNHKFVKLNENEIKKVKIKYLFKHTEKP